LISVYKLDDNMETYVDETSAVSHRGAVSNNEQIISLGEGFGKY